MEWELRLQSALCPGIYIGDYDQEAFLANLDSLHAELERLLTSAPKLACSRVELFLAACHHKIEEVDDSSEVFATVFHRLVRTWFKARQRTDADTKETLSRLVNWAHRDPFTTLSGSLHALVSVLDKKTLRAFRDLILEQRSDPVQPGGEGPARDDQHETTALLKHIYETLPNVRAYVLLCEKTGLDEEDCLVITNLYAARRPEEALSWARRGLRLDVAEPDPDVAHALRNLERDLLLRLGRQEEALTLAWNQFVNEPTSRTVEVLLAMAPEADHDRWRRRALQHVLDGPLGTFLEVALFLQSLDPIAGRIARTSQAELRSLSHTTAELAAHALAEAHPLAAAALYQALGLGLLDARKSRLYDFALDHFASARECYLRAGESATWNSLAETIARDHHRKRGFMPGFRDIVDGCRREDETAGCETTSTPFLDEAREAWTSTFEFGDES